MNFEHSYRREWYLRNVGINEMASTIGRILGVLSVLLLLDHATDFGWVLVIEVILSWYTSIKDFILSPLKPVVIALTDFFAAVFNFELMLYDHWSDVFVLVSLYLGARSRSYWKSGLKKLAAFRMIWGIIIGLITGVAAGVSNPSSFLGNFGMVVAVVCGLAIFDIIDAAWAATFHRKSGLSWLQDWNRYAAFSMPSILMGIVFGALFYIGYTWFTPYWITVPGIVAILLYSVFLAFYWLYRGFLSSRNSNELKTGYEKFASSSNSQIGFLMLGSFQGAAMVMAASAGWSLLDS